MVAKTWSTLAVVVTIALLCAAPAVAAVQEISNCDANVDPDVNCSSDNCKLTADIDCDSDNNEKITLANGKDLDLNGFDISCTPSVDCTTPIVITHDGSIVENKSASRSAIKGDFDIGVDCSGKANTKVLGLEFELTKNSANGITGCRVVEGNVVRWTGSGSYGNQAITVVDAANSRVGDNYVAGQWARGIFHEAVSSNATTDHNIIVMEDDTLVIQVGIWANGDTGSVTGNLFFGGTLPANPSDFFLDVNGANPTPVDGNYCDPAQDACQDCIGSGHCEPHPAVAPFVFP